MTPHLLADYVSVRGRFHRSVNLPGDWSRSVDLSEYVVTETVRDLADRIIGELFADGGSRAWSITGPFGSGKSAFSLFLGDTLCRPRASHPVAKELRQGRRLGRRRFLPVFLVAERRPLKPMLVEALAASFEPFAPALASGWRKVLDESDISGDRLSQIVLDAAAQAKEAGYGGLFIAVDELGKFLEFAAASTRGGDLLFLQQVAETAARSSVPVLLTTILHSGFADYLPVGDDVQRVEWQKVQGRFTDIAFQLPAEQLLALVGHAIEVEAPDDVVSGWTGVLGGCLRTDVITSAVKRLGLSGLLAQCLPLHPTTALLLWPLFRSKIAQNERSLFAFLTSHEPYGFQHFLRESGHAPDRSPLYRLPNLYDYVANALGLAAFRGDHARRWSLVDQLLSDLPAESPQGCREVVKSLGLLTMYGPQVGLSASAEVLQLALPEGTDVSSCLSYLESRSMIVYRRHRSAYALWEGSDVDLEEAYQTALYKVSSAGLAKRVNRALSLEPLVARGHYIETGTLRLLERKVVSAAVEEVAGEIGARCESDGKILFLVPETAADQRSALDLLGEVSAIRSSRPVVIGIPKVIDGLVEALKAFEAWTWVESNIPELQGDRVARKEVRSRLAEARVKLDRTVGQLFGVRGHVFDPSQSLWHYDGSTREFATTVEFQSWLSELCSAVYHASPGLNNELLNRSRLSSAAAAARRNLLERMERFEGVEDLGIEGTPPEASMYFSMLREGGFHHAEQGTWSLGEPRESWAAAWRLVTDKISGSITRRCDLTELIEALKAPPYGLKDGPIPVLLWAVFLSKRHEIALYEDSLFVPGLSVEVVERLVRRPETFEVQSYALDERQTEALEALDSRFLADASESVVDVEPSFLRIVKQLVLFAARLNAFTKRTRRLEPSAAVDLRNALLDAQDPKMLLFGQIPEILEIDLNAAGSAHHLAERLDECLRALSRAFPDLLDEIERRVSAEFGLSQESTAAREQLAARAGVVTNLASDPALRLFVNEISNDESDRDWREAVGGVLCKGKPPSHWRDADIATFQVNLALVAQQFERLEELALATQKLPGAKAIRIGVIDGSHRELRRVVTLDPELEAAAEVLAGDLFERLVENSQMGERLSELRIAALTKLAERLMPESEPQGVLIDG